MKHVLIIEDEPDVAETMRMLVERAGYSAECVIDPKKSFPLMKKCDIILLDIMMPSMSGREVLAEMKKRKIGKKVIVVSAVGLPGEVFRELSKSYSNVAGFVSKTKMYAELPKEIEASIGK